jgi:hypothetical protein
MPDGIPVPADVAAEMRATLGGELRLRLYERIAGRKNVAPNFRRVLRYLRKTSLTNAAVGDIDFTIFYGRRCYESYKDLPSVTDIPMLLEQLESDAGDRFQFLEVSDCPPPFPATLGVAVSNATLLLPGGGRLYVLTFLCADYPKGVTARLEIRASRANPDHTFSILTGHGWKAFTVSDAGSEPWINLALQCLEVLRCAKPMPSWISIPVGADSPTVSENAANLENLPTLVDDSGEPITQTDPDYDQRLLAVCARQMPCTVVRIPLTTIRPYSADRALDVPKATVDRLVAALRRGASPQMLLYWNGSSFIVSDDYALYLAERALEREAVEAVVMGEIPTELSASVLRRGGPELIPDAGGLRIERRSPGYSKWMKKYRRANGTVSPELLKLHLLYIDLARQLQRPWVRERDLHRLLELNPVILDAYGAEVRSEVRLGKSYRMDLVIQYNESDRRILCVELESPTQQLFTRAGRWDAKLTHAIQQVQDWMRWWREHPGDVPAPFDATIPINGLIIAGRDEGLDDSAKRRLLHNNHQFHDLSVVTYDDLLRRLELLLSSLGF